MTNKSVARLGEYEIIDRAGGGGAIRHLVSGEIMHSVNDPRDEARRLYVEQPGIIDLVSKVGPPLVIWDVGLGGATNALECIYALERVGDLRRQVQIISFERDLDPLRLVAGCPSLFESAKHPALVSLLDSGAWNSSKHPITWLLRCGDFLSEFPSAPPPEIIWYDPFSYKTNSTLWSVDVFASILAVTRQEATSLFTYSASTAVRATMLVAGWYVAPGVGSGPKSETTVAYNEIGLERCAGQALLGKAWFSRWCRSDAKTPLGYSGGDFERIIREHRQFKDE